MKAKLQTVTVPLSTLQEDAENARVHPEDNLRAITASLEEFGQVEPLLVRKGTNVVIGGNGRLACMKALGWKEAQVIMLELDEPRARALALALNRTSELAEWNEEKLANVLNGLGEAGVDLSVTGFDEKALSKLVADLKPDLDAFVKKEPEGSPVHKPPMGDGSWFYVEFYNEEPRFEALKALLGEHMTGLHEIDAPFFEQLVKSWAERA